MNLAVRALMWVGLTGVMIKAAASDIGPTEKGVPDAFVVQTLAATNAAQMPLQKCLKDKVAPHWRWLKSSKALLYTSVYRKVGEQNSRPGIDWAFLIVSAVTSPTAADALEQSLKLCLQGSGVKRIRSELTRATPASYHPAPNDRHRRPDLAFVVEFIVVRSDPDALKEYRETMRASIGPAVGRLVRENQFYSMIGLETAQIRSEKDASVPWNQLHIRGFYSEIGMTPAAMTRYMQELNPKRGDFRQVFKRLDAIRDKPRDDIAEEILTSGD